MQMIERPDLTPPVTRASIIAAMADAQIEREQIRRDTGVVILPDGSIVRETARHLTGEASK